MENTRVWKIASRWSEDGNVNSSVIGVFRKNNIVFLGKENDRDRFAKEVHCGDYFAVTDGIRVVAIAKAVGEPKVITEFKIQEIDKSKFDYEDWVWGTKVRIIDLPNEKQFDYCRGTFHSAESYRDKIIDLYNEDDKKFTIKSYTYVFEKTSNNDATICSILDSQIHYVIPIYQRIYSWTNNQIEKLIRDIFDAYWGVDGKGDKNPFFIGTMQLSEKKFIDKNKFEQNIIDGQQRLSTFLLLLKVLQLNFPEQLNSHKFDWLETRVNNGEQQIFLNEFLACDSINLETKTNNPYLKNAIIVNEILQQYIDNDDIETKFEVREFVEFISNQIYFVVIETCAGLSKTLQIFNSINTTGLDLNSGDLFKIRMYEYLTDQRGQDENAFEEISQIYQQIDILNNQFGRETDITEILSLYQYILISKYNLPTALFDYGQEKFFDELFDCLLGVQKHKNFINAQSIELNLDEIKRLVTIRYQWISGFYVDDKLLKVHTTKDYCMSHQIGWSRYSRYWNLRFLFAYQYPNDLEKLPQFMSLISKYLIIYSLLFEKTVYHAHSIIRKLMLEMFRVGSTVEEIILFMENEIQKEVPMRGNPKDALNNVINSNIFYSNKKKNIVCRLSAMFDEDGLDSSSLETIKPIIRKLYNTSIDIEHIHASADEAHKIDDILQNSIGNLVILEYDLNRSLGKKTYSEKRKEYQKRSQFATVLKIAENHEEWGDEQIKKRRDAEIKKLINYIFNEKNIIKQTVDVSII